MEKYLLNRLYLIYPPFTNQEGEWLYKDKEVRENVKSSKLYMIVQREEVFFKEYEDIKVSIPDGVIKFKLQMGKGFSPIIRLDIKRTLQYFFKNPDVEMRLELGDRLIRITDSTNNKVILWFTPNKFLFDYYRGNVITSIDGEFNHRNFTRYYLHYVGISKENDSFSRLFKNAHHGRLKILSNESPINCCSRVTDEMLLLLFDIDKTNINIASNGDNIEEWFGYTTDSIKVVADAEKAFVNLLETKYNKVRFTKYPLGSDGLVEQGLKRYGYSIGDDISLLTKTEVFNGSWDQAYNSDCIIIEGESATILKIT